MMEHYRHDFHKWEVILLTVYLIIVMMLGIFGNALVCVIFGLDRRLRTTANLLVISLAVADALQSINMSFMIISAHSGKWILGETMCQIAGFTNIAFITTSLLCLFLVSINRYYIVVKKSNKEWFTAKRTSAQLAAAWLLPAAFGIAPILGWSEYKFRPGKLMCTLSFKTEASYALTLCFVFLFLPFSIMCFSNWRIFKTLRQSHNRVAVSSGVTIQRNREEFRVASMLLVVIVFFATFYFPAAAINLVEMGAGTSFTIPQRLDITCTVLAMTNHANNPFIYGLMNRNFRKALFHLLRKGRVTVNHATNVTVISYENRQ